jgi:hypothetical protein
MLVEENKAIIRQVYDYCNNRERETYFALFAHGYIFHSVDGDLPLEQLYNMNGSGSLLFLMSKRLLWT